MFAGYGSVYGRANREDTCGIMGEIAKCLPVMWNGKLANCFPRITFCRRDRGSRPEILWGLHHATNRHNLFGLRTNGILQCPQAWIGGGTGRPSSRDFDSYSELEPSGRGREWLMQVRKLQNLGKTLQESAIPLRSAMLEGRLK